MAYKVGQIRGSNLVNTTFSENINVNIFKTMTGGGGADPVLYLGEDKKITSDFCYFISGKILQDEETSRTYNLKLVNASIDAEDAKKVIIENPGDYVQVRKIKITKHDPGSNEYEDFSIAFQSMLGSYNAILFETERLTSGDNFTTELQDDVNMKSITNLLQENNIFVKDGKLNSIAQIGIQAEPGFLMVINGEPIQVGRTRIYEIPVDYRVTYFGVVPREEKENFIVDYKYNKDEEVRA